MTRNVRMSNPTHRYDTTGESGPTGKPTVQWSYEFDSDIGAIAVWDGQVYVTGEDGSISVFDTDGNPQWRFQTDGGVTSSPAVVDDTVYVGSYDGHVYALEASGGTKQWSFQTDGSVVSSPVVKDESVYVAGGDTVYALGSSDTGSGETKLFERCSACQTDLTDYADLVFCPSCGADLSDSQGETQIYDPD
jgi:outer membrane protein assembly factor BamB